MPGQAAVAVMVLAMDVARYGARERDVPRAGNHGQSQLVFGQARHQLGHGRAGLRGDQLALVVDRDDLIQSGHVEHSPQSFWAASP